MKLIVGLGNPGQEYSDTRHNVGFRVTEELAERHHATFRKAWRARARMAKIPDVGEGVLVVQPTTFMNLSGMAVAHFRSYYGIELPEMLVVVDDADLPLGRLRIRASGSAGGHKGLKSIIGQLGSNEFPRLRIGVGRDTARDLADHVLSRFDRTERDTIDRAVRRAVDAADLFVTDGIAKVMNTFNSQERESQPDPEPKA